MKKLIFSILFIVSLLLFLSSENFSDKLNTLENEFNDLKSKITTLDQFLPSGFPGFKDLEKTNQLVEQLDFNKRKFKLYLAQYNLVTDNIFPFCKKYSDSPLNDFIVKRLKRFTGSGPDSLITIQKWLNNVLLKISRIEKEIDMVQLIRKNKESSDRNRKDSSSINNLSLSSKLNLLSDSKREAEDDLKVQFDKVELLKKEEKKRSDKIAEKREEIKKLKAESAKSSKFVVKLINITLANATELRINGLEIPLLNTTKTMLYLTNTKITALKENISDIEKKSTTLKEIKKKELIKKLLKGIMVIIIAIFIVLFLIRLSRVVSKKALKRVDKSEKMSSHRKQRYQTLSSVVLSFVKIVLWISAVVWVLGVLDIDYGPFLLAAGGISLAIGFGAQSLVKDIVTGFFLLMEEQFALGDFVEINGKSGTIEKISLRTIKFRSLDGTLHIIPNGEISIVSNSTYQWSRAVINIGVSYDVESSIVMDVLNSICDSMYSVPKWKRKLIERPFPQGIISFGDSSVNYRILAKTKTGEQWEVEREFNIRIQKAFNDNKIDIPYNFINVINVKQ